MCYVPLDYEHEVVTSMSSNKIVKNYELPDGQTISLSNVSHLSL
jgi:hypothetical protein